MFEAVEKGNFMFSAKKKQWKILLSECLSFAERPFLLRDFDLLPYEFSEELVRFKNKQEDSLAAIGLVR